jgi:hypothetical protein
MKTNMLVAAALGALALAAPASAQNRAGTTGAVTPERDLKINQLIVYGSDPCPRSTDEITVCARRPEQDRYRIPGPLRQTEGPESNSWANRASELQYVGRNGIQSCSTVGPGGASGCLTQLINEAVAERQNGDGTNWNALIEKARRERLGNIDRESEEIDRQQSQPK